MRKYGEPVLLANHVIESNKLPTNFYNCFKAAFDLVPLPFHGCDVHVSCLPRFLVDNPKSRQGMAMDCCNVLQGSYVASLRGRTGGESMLIEAWNWIDPIDFNLASKFNPIASIARMHRSISNYNV